MSCLEVCRACVYVYTWPSGLFSCCLNNEAGHSWLHGSNSDGCDCKLIKERGKQEHKRLFFKHWLPESLHRAKVGQAGQQRGQNKSSWDVSVHIPLQKSSHDGCTQGMVGTPSRYVLTICLFFYFPKLQRHFKRIS